MNYVFQFPHFSFARMLVGRSWIVLLKKQLLEGKTVSYTNISSHFWQIPLGLFYQVTKVTEIIFKSHSWVQVQPKTCNKFKTKWKGNRNPQTCHWRRASQTTQSWWCLFAFFFTLTFKKCLVPYCSFLLPKRPWRTESSTTKSFSHVQFVFNSSEN